MVVVVVVVVVVGDGSVDIHLGVEISVLTILGGQ